MGTCTQQWVLRPGRGCRLQVDVWERASAALGRANAGRGPVGPGGAAPSAEDRVEYEGMLVSAAAAEGRRFVLTSTFTFVMILSVRGCIHSVCAAHAGPPLLLMRWLPGDAAQRMLAFNTPAYPKQLLSYTVM